MQSEPQPRGAVIVPGDELGVTVCVPVSMGGNRVIRWAEQVESPGRGFEWVCAGKKQCDGHPITDEKIEPRVHLVLRRRAKGRG